MKLLPRFIALSIIAITTTLLALPATASDAVFFNNKGVEFYERGNYPAAIQNFLDAAQTDPGLPGIYANLGYAYQGADDHRSAVDAFKQAIIQDPTDYELHNSLGISLYKLGRTDQAIDEWNFVLTYDSNNSNAALNLRLAQNPQQAAITYKQQKFEQVGSKLYNPEYSYLLNRPLRIQDIFNEGKFAYRNGNYKKAIDMLSELVKSKPESKFSHFYLGMSYAYTQQPTKAMYHLREYLVLESYPPESPQLYKTAQTTFTDLKNGRIISPAPAAISPARATLAPANVIANEAYITTNFDKGKNAYISGDYFVAIEYLKKVLAEKPDSYPANYYIGMSYRAVNDAPNAIIYLTKCLTAGPDQRNTEQAKELYYTLKELSR